MPLTDNEKKYYLQLKGLDPEKFDVVEEAPVVEASTQIARPSMSRMDAIKAILPRALIPGAAALPGMAAGAEIGGFGGPFAPATIPIGSIIGGIATSLLANKAQDVALQYIQTPEDYQSGIARQAQAFKDQPVVSQVTEAVPNLLGFKPANPLTIGKGLKQLLVGARPDIAAKAAIQNAAVNTGVGVGLDVGQQKILEKRPEVDFRRAALAGLLGGALSEPNSIGRKLGFESGVNPELPVAPETPAMPRPAQILLPERTGPINTRPAPEGLVVDPLGADYVKMQEALKAVKGPAAVEKTPEVAKEPGQTIPTEGVPKNISPEDLAQYNQWKAEMAKAGKLEQSKVNPDEHTLYQPAKEENKYATQFVDKLEKSIGDRENFSRVKHIETPTIIDALKIGSLNKNTLPAGSNQGFLKRIRTYENPDGAVALHEVTHQFTHDNKNLLKLSLKGRKLKDFSELDEMIKDPFIYSGYKNIEKLLTSNPEEYLHAHESAIDELLSKYLTSHYEVNSPLSKFMVKLFGSKIEALNKKLYEGKEAEMTLNPETGYAQYKYSEALPKFNSDTQTYYQPNEDGSVSPKLGLTPEQLSQAKAYAEKRGLNFREESPIIQPSGDQARGSYKPESRLVSIDKSIATPDTGYHEGSHGFLRDIRDSKLQGDRKVFENGVRAAGSEEALAEAIGKRIVDVDNAPLKSWLEDFWSNSKRLVRLGNDEDIVNHAARRARDDRPFAESPELHGSPVKTPSEAELAAMTTHPKENATQYQKPGKASPDKQPSNSWYLFRPVEETIRRESPKSADALVDFENRFRNLRGELENKVVQLTKHIDDKSKVSQWMHDMTQKGQSDIILSPRDSATFGPDSEIRKLLVKVHDMQRTKDIQINGRQAKDSPTYFPMPVDTKVLDILRTSSSHPVEATKLREDFIQHQIQNNPEIVTMSPDTQRTAAEEVLNTYLRGVSSPSAKGSPEYNAVRKAEGNGLPYSWVEKNPQRALQRYMERVSRDFAFYDAVQSKPEVSALYNVRDQFGNAPNVKGVSPVMSREMKTAYKRMTGEHTQQEVMFNSFEHMFRGFIMGAKTGVGNHIQSYANNLIYVPIKDLPLIVTSMKNLSQGLQDSMDKGVNRWNVTDYENQGLGVGYWADQVRNLGNIMRTIQGSNFIEKWTRAKDMALGTALMQASWGRAAKGDIESRVLLRKFGIDVDPKTTPMTRDIILEGAANFVERTQGTYGPKGLPAFMLEPSSPAYWILSLSKWGIEKANVVKADVINPAMKGDIAPLLKYGLGGLLVTGPLVLKFNEMWNNRRANQANLTELEDSGQASDYMDKVIQLASLAGLGGITSDFAKAGFDKFKKRQVKTVGIPSLDFLETDVISGFGDALQAINEGSSVVPTITDWMVNTIVNNTQGLKLVDNYYHGDDKVKQDKFATLKVYKTLTGQPVSDPTDIKANPYEKSMEKEFKKAGSLEEAKAVMNEKIKPKMASMTKDERKSEVANLKRTSYQTVPVEPAKKKDYLGFIRRTQGEERASALEKDKRDVDRLNRQKSRLVPGR